MTYGLSILVPIYNGARYIGPCLNSILQQMQPQHQLVIVDDGSTDNTADCIQQTLAQYPNCNVVSLRIANQGVAHARNLLLSQATKDIILFIDGDDLLRNDALLRIEHLIRQYPCDVLLTDVCRWDDISNQSKKIARSMTPNKLLRGDQALLQSFIADNLNYVWAIVAKRTLWETLGNNCFSVGMTYEDLAVITRLIYNAKSLTYVPEVFIDYRETPNSIVKTSSAHNLLSMVKASTRFYHSVDAELLAPSLKLQMDALATKYFVSAMKKSFGLPIEYGHNLRHEMRKLYLSGLFFPVESVLESMKSPSENHLLITEKTSQRSYRKASRQAKNLLIFNHFFAWLYAAKLRIRHLRRRT